ncbi:NADP-dependent oxidoreductase [Patulibacter sp. SYSU D01012]|uniref:NADP-dependent oxidoreductase n=1 Tax=Patulibacter sp. SYSU D01012 TaxID=2817381 RepID=UPI001B3058B8|nr:NADP-dependent oxidoreductase [Patulibacter sp. SYSU D01012]
MSQAVRFSRYGDPDVLEVVDVPDPQPGPGQVRLRVQAAAVNPFDAKMRSGVFASGDLEAPRGLGVDVAGVVDALGEGVTELAVGDEVLGAAAGGGYAELALARPKSLVRRPAGVPWEVAAGAGTVARTAYRTLELLGVGAGETVLVLGAAGGVGSAAVQLAVARGAAVVGVAAEDRQDDVRGLGATPVVRGEGWEERVRAAAPGGIDAVIDASGHGELGGAVALAGGPDRVVTVAADDAADHGVRFSAGDGDIDSIPGLETFVAGLADGTMRLPVRATFPLAAAADAHRELEAGRGRGKIVLLPGR